MISNRIINFTRNQKTELEFGNSFYKLITLRAANSGSYFLIMTRKKIIISICSVIAFYYLIGFPLTLLGIVNKWHLFPGGITLQFAGNQTTGYDAEITTPDHDGPYVFYKNDSILVTTITVHDSVNVTESKSYPKSERSNITIACTFINHPDWNFTTTLKDSLVNESTLTSGAKKIVAISDIEGNFERFRELLLVSNVIDSAYSWTLGDGHLVLVGDFFDRGLNVTECLWLIYNLEAKAKQAGGYVHFILGNHEIMNMSHDFRYVRKKYKENATLMASEYALLFKPETELGKWLSTKNIIEKVNDIIFVHGGISEDVLSKNLSLETINTTARPYYFSKKEERPDNDVVQILFNSHNVSPFWNRDYVNQTADSTMINRTLAAYESRMIIVGHTLVESIRTFYGGKVVAVDTEHASENSQALIIENEEYLVIDRKGNTKQIQ